ncbi:MAG: 3-phosphoshikimate 1-carboxyvinyltransferase [Acidimicrobiia bacterium]|nr:3-phosphoshikimate 1-carboxyvinyltransferase [Acidimicrobiia bacterium]
MTVRTFSGPSSSFHATVIVPGDKSLSHRGLILAAMARGASRLRGLGAGSDLAATISCLTRFGISVDGDRVESGGIGSWGEPGRLECANSGTTMRLLAGAASGRPFVTVLDGDASLRRRPMRRLVDPLAALGAHLEVTGDGTAPITVRGGTLHGAAVTIGIASAQVRSAVALAALQAAERAVIDSPPGFRDHTERWLAALGLGAWQSATAFAIDPGAVPPLDLEVPGDTSSAAFLWAAAGLGGSEVTTPGVSLNPGRTGLLAVLAGMGATVAATETGQVLGDPVGTVTVRGPVRHGMQVDGPLAVRSLDELPLVGLLGAIAEGETVVSGAGELRGKETDRITSTVALVRALGGDAEESADGFRVMGSGLRPGKFEAAGDHRLAMAAAVAATVAGTVEVVGIEAAAVSWPDFADTLERSWSSR